MLSLEKLGKSELEKFLEAIRLFEQVFEMENFSMPATEHLQKLLAKSDFFVFVAQKDNKVIGAITVYVLEQYYSVKPLAYIYDLAVATAYQRQGVGKSLIAEVNKFCRERGFEEVFVQADKVDAYALDFYRSTQPTEEEAVVHFYYTLGASN